jgi:molybdopterin-guanine dinucleotide biosynthesis protein A
LRVGFPLLRAGRGALRAVIDRLQARAFAAPDARMLANVNTPADYAALRAQSPEPC